jgi:hypothetical protein
VRFEVFVKQQKNRIKVKVMWRGCLYIDADGAEFRRPSESGGRGVGVVISLHHQRGDVPVKKNKRRKNEQTRNDYTVE